ncbi:MAG TPA: helix-turn-helix transcriptional regulator [Firmicutes bacterium]|nr:helix-turn-helix transcriptional regulator [Bacillota bacterium]
MRRRALIAARKALRLNQAEMAQRLSISLSHYQKIECGKRTPSLAIAARVADFLGQPVEALFLARNGKEDRR